MKKIFLEEVSTKDIIKEVIFYKDDHRTITLTFLEDKTQVKDVLMYYGNGYIKQKYFATREEAIKYAESLLKMEESLK